MTRAFALLLLLSAAPMGRAEDVPLVAAASDLRYAIAELAAGFQRERGRSVKVTLGSSGHFHQQIANGAPFQLYLSADEHYVLSLHRAGRTADAGTLYAIGRIVLFAAHGSPLKPDAEMKDLARALSQSQIQRFAIANPQHAPYGRAAREALTKLGLWDRLEGRLVLGENVSQAAQFATTGSAQGAIIAYSLALAPGVAKLGTHALLPEALHEPLRQRMVLTRTAGETARQFYRFLQEKPAREIFRRHGFELPRA